MAKPKPNVRELSVEILNRSLRNGAFADELISTALKKEQLKSEDRALLLELVQGTLRWRGQLAWLISQYFRGDFKRSPDKLQRILELSLYQLKFLDKVPDYAAVSEGVELAKKFGGKGWGKMVNGILRSYLRDKDRKQPLAYDDDPATAISVNFSHPKWIVKRWLARYGFEKTIAFCECNNNRPQVSLRVNSEKTTTDKLRNELEQLGFAVAEPNVFDDFLVITKARHDVTQLPQFQQGHFTIQDESTVIPGLLLDPQKGERILDLCAAPGGKACHIAQLMEDKGTVVAVDRDWQRLQRVSENRQRLDLNSVFPVLADGPNVSFKGIDKILIDAPCSGLGVLAKRADLRWKRTLDDINAITNVQLALLKNAAAMLETGGVLVYSTCTTEPEENENLIAAFLEEHPNFRVEPLELRSVHPFMTAEGYYRTLPFEHGTDGTFAVRLVKVETLN